MRRRENGYRMKHVLGLGNHGWLGGCFGRFPILRGIEGRARELERPQGLFYIGGLQRGRAADSFLTHGGPNEEECQLRLWCVYFCPHLLKFGLMRENHDYRWKWGNRWIWSNSTGWRRREGANYFSRGDSTICTRSLSLTGYAWSTPLSLNPFDCSDSPRIIHIISRPLQDKTIFEIQNQSRLWLLWEFMSEDDAYHQMKTSNAEKVVRMLHGEVMVISWLVNNGTPKCPVAPSLQ